MTISGINGGNLQAGQSGSAQAMDSYSRNIQKQIMNVQKQLQELSSNEKMSPEEKMKKRQELQQQINDLNMQLKQHQMEQRREKQQEKQQKTGSMEAMISADSSMKQSKVQGSVATRMKDRAGVLESEIKLDSIGAQGASKKKEELADVEQKAMQATASQMSTLADANRTLKEAATADKKEERAEEDEKTESKSQDKTHVDIRL